MKNYKINIDRPKVSSEEIASRADFNAILKNYKAAPSGSARPGWFAGGAAVVTVVAVLSFLIWKSATNHQVNVAEEVSVMPEENTAAVDLRFIQPVAHLDVPYVYYNITAEKGGVLNYKTGSKITVPERVFVDGNGREVKGEIQIRYRELHDAVDFFVSGIPLEYASGNRIYTQESAGMLDIRGFQNGQQIFVAPGRNIEVELSSLKDGQFTIYTLDSISKSWRSRGPNVPGKPQNRQKSKEPLVVALPSVDPDSAAATPEIAIARAGLENARKQVSDIVGSKPVLPARARKKPYRFEIVVDSAEFPEVAIYKGLMFEVGEENTSFTSKYYDYEWETIKLSEIEKGVKYKLELVEGKTKLELSVKPVLLGSDYDLAKKEYEKKFKEYQARVEVVKAAESEKQAEYDRVLEKYRQQQIAAGNHNTKMSRRESNGGRFKRYFSMDHFGIWNLQNPKEVPVTEVKAKFADESKKNLNFRTLCLIEKGSNGIFRIKSGQGVRFNRSEENILLGIQHDGSVAVYSFAGESIPSAAEHTFPMKVVDRKFNSVEEVKDYLNI